MSAARISIDFTGTPLQVGGFQMGKYIVASGSKGIKLTGKGALATTEEVVAGLEDARDSMKYSFSTNRIDSAVVVVPNATKRQNIYDILESGRHHGFNITEVIYEYVAVSAAYIQKNMPSEKITLAVISLWGGFLDVSIVTIVPLNVGNTDYELILEAHKYRDEAVGFDESKQNQESADSGVGGPVGLVGGAVEALVADPFEKAFNILKDILGGLELQPELKVEKLVFVGEASNLEKVRQAAKESFPDAAVWDENEKPQEIAAYGAAFLSYTDKKLPSGKPGDNIFAPLTAKNWPMDMPQMPIEMPGEYLIINKSKLC